MENEPVEIEHTFPASANQVWSAITDKDKMKEWYFDIEKFQPEVGFKFQFYGGTEDKPYLHLCEITEVIPQKKISYTWSYETDPAVTLVTFELFAKGDETTVRLTHQGVEKFSSENPDLTRENFEEGWKHIIKTALKEYLQSPVQ